MENFRPKFKRKYPKKYLVKTFEWKNGNLDVTEMEFFSRKEAIHYANQITTDDTSIKVYNPESEVIHSCDTKNKKWESYA